MAHPEILISTNRTAALAEHERRLAAGESRSVPEAYYSNIRARIEIISETKATKEQIAR